MQDLAGSNSNDSPLAPQARPSGIPPGEPPATAVGVDEPLGPVPAPRRFWGLLDVAPVVLFLLFLASLSLMSAPDAHMPAEPVNVRALLAVQSVFYLLILLYIYSVVRIKHRMPFWAGLRWLPTAQKPAAFFLGGIALAVVIQLLPLPMRGRLPIERLFETPEAAYMLAFFGIAVAPLVEELVFRGFIFTALEGAWGLTAAVWGTSLLFAVIHVPQLRGGGAQILAIFCVGVVLSWLRGRTGSLAPPYLVHLAYNTSMFVLLYAGTRGFTKFGA